MVGDRVTTGFLRSVGNQKWAVRPNLMGDLVEQHGSAAALKFFASSMPKYEKILKTWGPLRTHYLATAISVINGCRYCAYGHGFAYQLHYFDRFGSLYPIDEERMLAATGGDRARTIETFKIALEQAGLNDEVPWLDRLVEVLDSGPGDTKDDDWLQHLIEMFAFLNSCGINGKTEIDEAHDPINKDKDLKERYKVARLHFL